jgi:hypothetical protein
VLAGAGTVTVLQEEPPLGAIELTPVAVEKLLHAALAVALKTSTK